MEQNNFISKEDINSFKARHSEISVRATEEVRYSTFYCENYTFEDGSIFFPKKYILEPRIYIGLVYRNGFNAPVYIVSLDAPYIYTGSGDKCIFADNIFYRLEAGNRFFIGVHGDVYKPRTTTTASGVKVRIGESSSISFEISISDDYIKNVGWDYHFYSPELEP